MYKTSIVVLFLTLLLLLPQRSDAAPSGTAVVSSDSLSYDLQRQRINKLLESRRQRFGEFDESLLKKSGIFGIFKSKRDREESISILKEIVLYDNHIFLETKKLLDLKDVEKMHYQELATRYDEQSSAYMRTITKLQTENDKLRQNVSVLQDTDSRNDTALYIISVLLLLAVLYIVRRHLQQRKHQKVTKL